MSSKRIHVVTYTHWHREFRQEFERTRMRLVDCMDTLLEIMEKDPRFTSFMLDGQLTMVDDYLEVRPERLPAIVKLVQEGRLETGPWYTLPDCAPIDCECVIRNLLFGSRKSLELGGVMRVGYSLFSFGQIAQMPQIYKSFGMETVFFYKHMDPSRSEHSEFIWEAPDGSKVLATRLGREARWNFFMAAQMPLAHDGDPWAKDWCYLWGEGAGKLFRNATPGEHHWFYESAGEEDVIHQEQAEFAAKRLLETFNGTVCPDVLLAFNGHDSTVPHSLTTTAYDAVERALGGEYEVVQSTLAAYAAELKAWLDQNKTTLEVVSGPMRDGPVSTVQGDVLSVHPDIGEVHSEAVSALLLQAEPLAALAWASGLDAYPVSYLERAWRILFQAQAHDSLHGLGPRTLIESELARLRDVRDIAKGLHHRALRSITGAIGTAGLDGTGVFLAVHNTTAVDRSEVVEAYVDIPGDDEVDYVIIESADGRPALVQELSRSRIRAGVMQAKGRAMPLYCTRVHLLFHAESVPSCGYKTYKVSWVCKAAYPYLAEDWHAARIMADNLVTGPHQAENEHIRVQVNSDGTLDLYDKVTEHQYHGLNYFADQGEMGNLWMSSLPGYDQFVLSANKPAEIAMCIDGPLAVQFNIRTTMRVSAEFDWQRGRRSEFTRDLLIETKVTLKKGSPYIEIEATVHNTVKDHYLKVCFPTDISTGRTWAEGGYWVTNYPVKASRVGQMQGTDLLRHPAKLWFDLWDGLNGLGVLIGAPKDYEVFQHDIPGTLAMGLVRGVRTRLPAGNRLWMEYPNDDSAQSLGCHTFRYALAPHKRRWDHAGLTNLALAFKTPMQVCQFGRQQGTLPTEASALSLNDPTIQLASIKKAEDHDSIVLRIVNATNADKQVTIKAGFPIAGAWMLRMTEEREHEIEVKENAVEISANKGQILTIEFALRR